MKKLLVCLALAAFAAMTSLQAGEPCTKDKAACSSEGSTSSCCAAKATAAKTSCSAGKVAKVVKRNADVKGATLLVKR
jgi:hypothetical protein